MIFLPYMPKFLFISVTSSLADCISRGKKPKFTLISHEHGPVHFTKMSWPYQERSPIKVKLWAGLPPHCSTMKKRGKCSPSISSIFKLHIPLRSQWKLWTDTQERNKGRHIHPNTILNDLKAVMKSSHLLHPECSGSCGHLLCSPAHPLSSFLFRALNTPLPHLALP